MDRNLSSLIFLTFMIIFVKSETNCSVNHQEVIEKIIKNQTKVGKSCVDDLREIYHGNLTIHEVWSNFNCNHKYGNSHDLGDFLGCKNFEIPTQYCMGQYFNIQNPPILVPPAKSLYQSKWTDLDVSFLGAICLPTSCTADDVKDIFNVILNRQNLTVGQEVLCKTYLSDNSSWNWKRFILYISIAAAVALFSTIGKQELKPDVILKDLFNMKPRNPSTTYLNGIKAIISFSTILVHVWYFRIYFPFKNGENLLKFQTDFYFVILFVMNCFMEIFFIIGGILTAKCLAKDYKNCSKITWIVKFYIKRFMRLVPVVLLIIALVITSNDEFSAPYSFAEDKELYIGVLKRAMSFDFRDIEKLFKVYKWFVLVYIKLTIIAPFIFMGIKSQNHGKSATICIISIAAIWRHSHAVEFYSTVANNGDQLRILSFALESLDYYMAVHYRFLSFFGGLVIEQYTNEKFRFHEITLKSIGTVLSISMTSESFFLFFWKGPRLAASFNILNIACFILGFHALHFHTAKFKKFLSHKFWMPISKMSLSLYLMSSYVQSGIHRHQLDPLDVENLFQFILLCVSDFFEVVVPIILTFVLVEEPFARIGEIIAEKL